MKHLINSCLYPVALIALIAVLLSGAALPEKTQLRPGIHFTLHPHATKLADIAAHARFLRAHAQQGESWRLVHGASVYTNAAQRGGSTPRAQFSLLVTQPAGCVTSSSQPAPIVALVAALKCDPDLIFEYVYNNVEFEPLYGSNKGPLGTLLDLRGDDADQAMLLVTLLNTAGYSATQFAWSTIRLTGAQMSGWLGVNNDATAIEAILNDGGIPYQNATANGDGTLNHIDVSHFVAQLQLSGTWYYFDPSYKQHTMVSGLSNLGSALGYSRTQFLSDAGGTIASYSISTISRTSLRSDLVKYATNLVSYINQNNPAWTVQNIIGGKTIQKLTGSPIRQTTFPNLSPSYPFIQTNTTFPSTCPAQTISCQTALSITMPGALSTQAINLTTDQVYGHRITVFFSPSGGNFVPTLLIDGVAPSCVGAGTCTNVGPASSSGTQLSLATSVTQPNQPNSSACPTGITATACQTLTIVAGTNGNYLVSTGIGQVGRGLAEYHRQLLGQAVGAGNSNTSELVLGESFAVLSYNWFAELSSNQQMVDQLAQTKTIYNFGIGLTAQTNIQATTYQGPYFSMPLNYMSVQPLSSSGPTITIGSYTYPVAFASANLALSKSLSSLQSAVLLQTQAQTANMTAASSIMLIDANMNSSYSGSLGTTYLADGTTTAGQSAYTSTIEPIISSYYSSDDLSAITAAVAAGQQVLIPKQGTLSVGVWSGGGYTEIFPESSTALVLTQLITGGISGGSSGTNVTNPAANSFVALNPSANPNTVPTLINGQANPSSHPLADPLDGVTGAFLFQHDDLVTGSGKFPYALTFSRTYQSASGTNLTSTTADVGMGNGWMHTYSITAKSQSDPFISMGAGDFPAIGAATSIAGLYVAVDLLSVTPTAQTITVSSMVTQWFTDQLTGNTVFVTQPGTSEEFIALPHADGSTNYTFYQPPSSSARMTQTAAGQYAYKTKDGVILNFGPTPAGALQSWVFPMSVTVSLIYNGSSQLTKVSNNLGRSLALTYSGTDIATVTDDTGRSVNYIYNGSGNLTRSTDPLGNTIAYAYDASGTYDTFGHLTQIFYPFRPNTAFVTNWYDALGRVNQQANGNGYISKFYFAGPRTEMVDALGNREVTYQTDQGMVVSDAWVLSSSFGDVFNDTVQDNGVVNVTTNQFDGIGRPTQTTYPEGGTTSYTYVTSVNPWANNIASVTRTAKPGSSLSPLTTSYTYDPTWNKVTSVTDPLGLVTKSTYDPATGNLLSTIADAGPSPHFNQTNLFSYDAFGGVLTATNPIGTVTTFQYRLS